MGFFALFLDSLYATAIDKEGNNDFLFIETTAMRWLGYYRRRYVFVSGEPWGEMQPHAQPASSLYSGAHFKI